MLARFEVFPLLSVHADLPRGLPQAAAGVPVGVREDAAGLRANHAKVQIPVARANVVRTISGVSGN